jgi:hypothetical protein
MRGKELKVMCICVWLGLCCRASEETIGLCVYHTVLVLLSNATLCYASYDFEVLVSCLFPPPFFLW